MSEINMCNPDPRKILRNQDKYSQQEIELAIGSVCDMADSFDERISMLIEECQTKKEAINWLRSQVETLIIKNKALIES